MATVDELIVRIKADASQLEREMAKVSSTVKRSSDSMGSSISGLAAQFRALAPAIGTAGLVAFAKNASLAADKLNDLAARSGIASTTLSAFDLPLRQAGSSVEEFSSLLVRMNNSIGEAASGNETAAKMFSDIGLSAQELINMSPEQQFQAIASALNGIGTQAEFTNKGMAIFGRQFASASPLVRQLGSDMDEFIKKQQALGNSFTQEELQMVNDFWDNMESWIKKTEVALIRLIGQFANLKQNIKEGDLKTEAYHAARNAGMSYEQARSVANRVSSSPGATVNEATILLPTRSKSAASKSAGAAAPKELEDYNQHVKDQQEALRKAAQEAERFNQVLTDKLSAGLTDAVFSANSAGDAMKRMAMSIAQSIFEKQIAQPIAGGIMGALGSGVSAASASSGGGIFDFFSSILPSFDVGSYNVPNDMMANIHKGEMIIPRQQAESLRNGGMGGGVTVNQSFTINAGVSAEVRAQVAAAAPVIASAAKAAVFDDMKRGGTASRIAGLA